MSDYWEPVTYNIGDVVRVRLSAECNARREEVTALSEEEIVKQDMGNKAHPRMYDGKTGIVVDINREDELEGHFYRVAFLSAIPYKNFEYRGADFAWLELERITMGRRLTAYEEKTLLEFCYLASCEYPTINYSSVENTTI